MFKEQLGPESEARVAWGEFFGAQLITRHGGAKTAIGLPNIVPPFGQAAYFDLVTEGATRIGHPVNA
jgi:hypothetical protein